MSRGCPYVAHGALSNLFSQAAEASNDSAAVAEDSSSTNERVPALRHLQDI